MQMVEWNSHSFSREWNKNILNHKRPTHSDEQSMKLKQNQTKSNQIESNQNKSKQIKLNQINPN